MLPEPGNQFQNFLVPLTPGWADVIWFPRFKLGFPSRIWAPEAGFLFFFHWKSFVRFPYQRQEKHEWVCRRLSEGLPLQSNSGFWYFLWQSRVSQGIPSSNVLDAAVRKTRKAVQEEKHVPPRCAPKLRGKPQTVNSGESISPIFPEIRDTIKILPMFPSLAAQPGNLSAKRKFQ